MLKGLSEADQEVIEQKTHYDNEELIIENLKNELARAQDLVDTFQNDVSEEAEEQDSDLEVRNTVLIKGIQKKYATKFGEIKKQIAALARLFDSASLGDINEELRKWEIVKNAFDKKYEDAKAKASVNQQQLEQIRELETRIAELKKQQRASGNALKTLGNPDAIYGGLKTKWNELHTQKMQTIEAQCTKFSALSNGLIKADIGESLDIEFLKQ
jgi:hypothetical protein